MNRALRLIRWLGLAALALAAPASAQDAAPPPTSQIVVTAPLNPDDLPTQAEAMPALDARASRRLATDSDRFVRCTGLPEPDQLRKILDYGARHPVAQKALHRYIASNQGCYIGYGSPIPESPFYGDCNPQAGGEATVGALCRVVYDRGTLYERAVKAYAGPLALGRMQTFDRTIRARFMQREAVREKHRVPLDRTFFRAVGCMVQIAPEYGTRLLDAAPGSTEEARARGVLIGLGAPCVGGVTDVQVDATQFRAYAAEAVYEWLVAVKGEGTLVPG